MLSSGCNFITIVKMPSKNAKKKANKVNVIVNVFLLFLYVSMFDIKAPCFSQTTCALMARALPDR